MRHTDSLGDVVRLVGFVTAPKHDNDRSAAQGVLHAPAGAEVLPYFEYSAADRFHVTPVATGGFFQAANQPRFGLPVLESIQTSDEFISTFDPVHGLSVTNRLRLRQELMPYGFIVSLNISEGLDFADALHHAAYRHCDRMASFDDRKFAHRAKRLGLAPPLFVPRGKPGGKT